MQSSPFNLPAVVRFLEHNRGRNTYDWVTLDDAGAYTGHEVRVLIKLAQMEIEQKLRRELQEVLSEKLYDAIDRLEQKFDHRFELLTQAPPTFTSRSAPGRGQRTDLLPALDRITRLEVQYFDNSKKADGQRKSTQALYQLKLTVAGYQGYWLLPLHRPDRAEGRKRIQEIMPYLDEIDPDRQMIKHAGCLVAGRKIPSQSAYIDQSDQIKMRLYDTWIDFTPPKCRADGEDSIAPEMRWFYPD